MKKYIFLLTFSLSIYTAQSQEISYALRYAQDNLTGTARFRAMGGAFGALGGDFSSLNVNPAGSAVFANNQMALTLSNFGVKNSSNYFRTKTTETTNSFDLNQAGAVFVFKNSNTTSNWKKVSLAINYENANNFDNRMFSGELKLQNKKRQVSCTFPVFHEYDFYTCKWHFFEVFKETAN